MTSLRPTLLALLAVGFMSANALAMTKTEYQAGQQRIAGDYKAHKTRCEALKDNAKDVCMEEAKGAEKVAKAELEAAAGGRLPDGFGIESWTSPGRTSPDTWADEAAEWASLGVTHLSLRTDESRRDLPVTPEKILAALGKL